MIRAIKIWLAKRSIRAAIIGIRKVQDSYDCGHAMLLELSSHYRTLCVKADRALDRLDSLGDKPPTGRFLK